MRHSAPATARRPAFRRVALLAFALALLLGAWAVLAPAPANADGTNTYLSGNWDPQIRPSGESGNACTNTRSYAANGGSNSVTFRVTTNGSVCSLSGGRNPTTSNWPRYEIKVASASGQHGSGSAIPGANITYVSGLASGTGSWRNVAGTTYNYRSVGISGAQDSGQIGHDGSVNDLAATFTVPVTHVGTAYLRFTVVGQPLGIFQTHEHIELAYADPHVAALPLAVPSPGGTLATGDLATTTRLYAASGASQQARIFLRDAWHSNTYTATETNAARSAFDSATIKITSDAAGATAIAGAKISSDAAGATAITACTESTPGGTCTITSANFPQASGMNPRTTPQDIYFSVPGSHFGPAYVAVTTAKSGKTARSFSLQYDPPAGQEPPVEAGVKRAFALPLVADGQGGLRLCTEDETGSGDGSVAACASPSAQQGAPLGFAAALVRGNRHPADSPSGSGTVQYREITQLRVAATGAAIHHRTLCPRSAPTHPVYRPAAQTDPASCIISSAALREFHERLSAREPIRPLLLALIPTAASGRATIEYTIAGTDPPEVISEDLDFTAAAGSPELAAAIFLDWTDPGSDYEAGRPEALFTIGRKDSRPGAPPAPASALPGGLAPATFADAAGAELSISQGTISFGDQACTPATGGCTVALTAAQLRGAAAANDPVGELRAAYRIPLGAAGPTTLTVRARPAAGSAVAEGMLAIEHPAISGPAAFAGLPADADAIIAPGGPAVELAAGFTIPVAAAGDEWACFQIDPSFYILQNDGSANFSCPQAHSLAVSRSTSGRGSSATAAWLDDASYLALSGPATFENGTKNLQLGGANAFSQLRCGGAVIHGLASAAERDLACWVTDAKGNRPKILIDSDADGAQIRFIASLAPVQGKRFHIFAGVTALSRDRQENAAAFVLDGPNGDGSFFLAGPAAFSIASVQQVASASLQRGNGAAAPVRSGQPADLVLAILNANGQAAELAAISSITLIAERGKLRAGTTADFSSGAAADNDAFCDGLSACTIPISDNDEEDGNDLASAARTNPRLIAGIPIQLYGVDAAGTVEVTAAVVASDGADPILAGPLAVEFAGRASSLALGDQLRRVNAFNTVGDDPATDAVETGADQVDAGDLLDRIMISVSAADADGRAAAIPQSLPSPRVVNHEGQAVSAGLSITLNDCNDARTMCNYIIDVNAPASDPLPSGVYTLTASIGSSGEASAQFGVAGPPSAIEFTPDPVPGLGRTFSVQVAVADASGEPVADGTPVAIAISPRGDAELAITRISPASQTAKNGSVTATFVVIGREVSVISARSGQASALHVVNALQAAAGQTAIAGESLTSTQPGSFAHYRGAETASAGAILDQIDQGAAVYLWNGKRWLYYATSDGIQIPGSLDFIIHPDDILWFAPSP